MKYFKPQIDVRLFSLESVHTDNSVTASAETYNDWALRQEQITRIEKKLIQLNEITKFKF